MTDTAEQSTAVPRQSRFPGGIPYIVGNEGAERFSYYGMKAILYVYTTSLLLKTMGASAEGGALSEAVQAEAKAEATRIVHLFNAGVYAFPMIGAILADRLLGKYPVIFWVSLIYCAGHAVLAVAGRLGSTGMPDMALMGLFLGLSLIAIGSGGIKPCVSANVGDQFTPENGHLVSRVFQIFYFIINFGSFFSTLLIPKLYDELGPEVAFAVPGVLMGVATIVFWIGRRKFRRIPPNPGGSLGLRDFVASSLFFLPIAVFILAFFAGDEGSVPVAAEGGGEPINGWSAAAARFVGTYWIHMLVSLCAVALGLVVFALRQRIAEDKGFLAVTYYAFTHRAERVDGMGFFDVARARFGDEAVEGPPAVLKVALVFSMVSVFWALFDQHGSTWVEQAGQMDLGLDLPQYTWYFVLWGTPALAALGGLWLFLWISNLRVDRSLILSVVAGSIVGLLGCLGLDMASGRRAFIELSASQLSALNPLMVMLIIPALNLLVYRPLERRGVTIKPLLKMTVGMFLAAVAFGAAAVLQMRIEALREQGDKLHALWQAGPYLIMTTAEVLVSVTGLEFAYTQAPRTMKSTIMGFWLLCVTGGNVLVAFLAPLQAKYPLSQFFWIFAALMAGAAVIFAVLAKLYRGKTYLQPAAPA